MSAVDKHEYKLRTEEMLRLMEEGSMAEAADIADTIDWRKVRNAVMLSHVGDIYEKTNQLQKSYEVLHLAYERSKNSRKVVYRLCSLAIKTGHVEEALDFYDDFVELAPKDPNQYILKYQILRARRSPIEQQIHALENFKRAEYMEKWAYELASLYHEAGMTNECLAECDELILWFSDGKYVQRAMELKMKYKSLSPSQQEKFNRRHEQHQMDVSHDVEPIIEPIVESIDESKEDVVPEQVELPVKEEAIIMPAGVTELTVEPESNEPIQESIIQADRSTPFIEDTVLPEAVLPGTPKSMVSSTMKLDEALQSLLGLSKPEPEVTPVEEVVNPNYASRNQEEPDYVKTSTFDDVSFGETHEFATLEHDLGDIENVVDLGLIKELADKRQGINTEPKKKPVPSGVEELISEPFNEEEMREMATRSLINEAETTVIPTIKTKEDVRMAQAGTPIVVPPVAEKKTVPEVLEVNREPDKQVNADESMDVLRISNTTTPTLPPDIQRMIDEIEGIIPPSFDEPELVIEDADESMNESADMEVIEVKEQEDPEAIIEEPALEESVIVEPVLDAAPLHDEDLIRELELGLQEDLGGESNLSFERKLSSGLTAQEDSFDQFIDELTPEAAEFATEQEKVLYSDEEYEEDFEELELEDIADHLGDLELENSLDEFEELELEDAVEEYEEADDLELEDAFDETEDFELEDTYEEADDLELKEDVEELLEDEDGAFDELELTDDAEESIWEEEELLFDDSEEVLFEEDEYLPEDDYEEDYIDDELIEEDEFFEEDDRFEEDDEFLEEDDRFVEEETAQEVDIMSSTAPLSRMETAKLHATGKTAPLPLDEISDALSLSDTGFMMRARYDLEAQAAIGARAGLTEEQKKLFSYFVPVRGMSEQLVDVLEQDKNCTNRGGTSRTGNLLIIGSKGSGKTVLAVDVIKAIQKQRNIKQSKVAIITGDQLNKKKISEVFSKLYGGALVIEKAGKLNEKTVARLNKAMEQPTGELLIVLEEQRKPLDRLLSTNLEFRRKFTSRLELPVFINDELVTFGQTYANENGYRIDEMGILALYSRIDALQREDHAVTVSEVKDIMDAAMDYSQKASAKKLVKRVFGKNTDDSDRIILSEKDFNS